MSSPQETVKLADEIRQRQAADRHFPTFATRGFGRRDRPSIQTDSTQAYGSSTDSANRRAASQMKEEDDEGQKDDDRIDASAAGPNDGRVSLLDDDDEAAGQLEMDYAPQERVEPSDEARDDKSIEARQQQD